jgi:hypothetical protein
VRLDECRVRLTASDSVVASFWHRDGTTPGALHVDVQETEIEAGRILALDHALQDMSLSLKDNKLHATLPCHPSIRGVGISSAVSAPP